MPQEWKAPLIAIAVTIAVLAIGGAVYWFFFTDDTDDVAANVKGNMQSYFNSNPEVSKYNITVKDVALVEASGNEYNGIATLRTARGGEDHKVPITVTWDGKNGIWQTERGSMMFLMGEELQGLSP